MGHIVKVGVQIERQFAVQLGNLRCLVTGIKSTSSQVINQIVVVEPVTGNPTNLIRLRLHCRPLIGQDTHTVIKQRGVSVQLPVRPVHRTRLTGDTTASVHSHIPGSL